MSAFIDLTGQRFGRLLVMSRGPNRKSGQAKWWCLCDCDSGVLIQAGHLKNGGSRSCGCLHQEIMQKRMSEDNPNWKGGITGKRNLAMSQTNYKEWRKQVYERDNFTCQECGDRGGTLNAHHIKDYSGNPELRTKVTNGITLCETCHRAIYFNLKGEANEHNECSK